MPPAVSRPSPSCDHKILTPNCEPSPKAVASFSPSQAVLITISVTPIFFSFSICQTMSGLSPTSSKGFGVCKVKGRIRLPMPAAKIIAFIRPQPHTHHIWLRI